MDKTQFARLASTFVTVNGEQKNRDGTVLTTDELLRTPLAELDVGSLSLLETVLAFEDEFGVDLGEVEMADVATLSDFGPLIDAAKPG